MNEGNAMSPSLGASQSPASRRRTEGRGIEPAARDIGTFEAAQIEALCERRAVDTHFRPIVRLDSGDLFAYEALARPPLDGPFSTATEMFSGAVRHGMLTQLELVCCELAVARFVKAGLRGRLVMTMSPEAIVEAHHLSESRFDFLRHPGLSPARVVVELADQHKAPNLERLCEAVMLFRSLGADIAVNDLGRGLSSLWLWSELRPELVKIGAHLVHGVHRNAIKAQLLRSIQQVADASGARLVAEGIEEEADYAALLELGISFGQGRLIGGPAPAPAAAPRLRSALVARSRGWSPAPTNGRMPLKAERNGERLLIRVPGVEPGTENERIFERFDAMPDLPAVAIVADGSAQGIIHRNRFLSRYGRPGGREALAAQPCDTFMDREPLLIERRLAIREISEQLLKADARHLEGFIFTDRGRYAGIGMGQDLMREMLLMQLEAARHANPLTQLPGNVPIDEHIAGLLGARLPFTTAYCDLNHFKAFNDVYGYRRGDDMIRLAARVLEEARDRRFDFLGHIGGDDFILVFRSPDWAARCRRALEAFDKQVRALFDEEDLARGTLKGEDRSGGATYSPMTSLSIGIVRAASGEYHSHLEIAAAAASAKKQAKRIGGNAMFVERRRPEQKNVDSVTNDDTGGDDT